MKEKTLKCGQQQNVRKNMSNEEAYTYSQKEKGILGHNEVLKNLTVTEYKRSKNQFI